MSEIAMKHPGEVRLKNRRVGAILLTLALLYLGAAIIFIIVY